MSKYNIEGGIDFYEELYKSLDENSGENIEEGIELCLITNTPLTENYVTLKCKHKFNYVALFKDLVNRKSKLSALDTQHLNVDEIRCPYCRNREVGLLPFYENMGVEKLHGINWIDETKILPKNMIPSYFFGVCNFKPNAGEEDYQCKNVNVCSHLDNKNYCYLHLKEVQRKEMKEKILMKKEEEKKQKQETKAKEKEAKLLAKEKAKEEKKQNNASLVNNENLVILSPDGCQAILKTGSRKGHSCGCKKSTELYCVRHSKINN